MVEGLTYLSQQDPENEDWLMVAIWPSQNLDPGIPGYYKTFQHQIIRVYLEQLPLNVQPLGLVLMRMMATERDPEIRQLAQRAVQASRATQSPQTIKLVEMLLAYRYPQLGAEELAKMFTFSKEEMKQTKVYQEGRQEGRQEGCEEGALSEKYKVITRLSQKGMDFQDIAAIVDLDPAEVQKIINATPNI